MSTKTTADKLLIKPNTTFWSSDAGRAGLIGPLPEGVREVGRPEEASTALVFADDAGSLRDLLARQKASALAAPAALWVA